MSNFRDGRKNRYRMSGDSMTPGEVTLPLSFFNFNLSGNKNLQARSNTHFSSLVTWIESPWSWDSYNKGSPLKISLKISEPSCQVRLGRLWTYQHEASRLAVYDPDWQGSYTISLPGSESTYTSSCSLSSSDPDYSHFNHSLGEQNIRGEPPAASNLSPITLVLV